jgi:hypothetical protein
LMKSRKVFSFSCGMVRKSGPTIYNFI